MRFRRRKAVPVAGRAAAGVLCLVLCLFYSLQWLPTDGYMFACVLCVLQRDKCKNL